MKISGIEISHPDKPLFPDKGITKADMVTYYHKISDRMLPFLKNRPLTLQRFPDGIDGEGFFQKHAQDYYPDFIERITIETEKGTSEQIICNSQKSLIYLANQGAISFHVWLSRKNDLHRPDKVVFDLDPSDATDFSKVKKAARIVGDELREEGIEARLMTTGKSGLHVFYGIKKADNFDEVRKATHKMAEKLVDRHPELLTLEMRKSKRGKKVFLDYLRNAYGQTAICPFSLRPTPKAGVATPVEWGELNKLEGGDHYHYGNIFRRLGAKAS
ncbi:non-homologous end-joining DNA ligase [Pricia sp. S334]|uniref:Non-homologous end-joining DNA ligase n=1 Tax=Pricia mediterranea TaxID=3076079 RepID=A0ABU3L2T8_9FLAO|nr:non-homologous end-joining DNA ligase [Pricia sp. S334]MDT7827573.1 non-homologous end-joining DNA ligase [Pricia sp. S334]